MEFANQFHVPLPLAEAWKLMLDVPRILPCLPGARLLETMEGNRYRGSVAVKLGPVKLSFDGQAELVRVSRDGTTRREFITLRDQQNVSVAFNPPLQNNDTVIVHRTLYAKSLDVLNQVLVPLATVGNYWWLYRSYWP